METTTDLRIIIKSPRLFTWGKVVQIQEMGSYTIVEYKDHLTDATKFHVYVDGRDTSNSTPTLEGALVMAIAIKHLDSSEASHMARGACKLLGVNAG